MQSFLKSFLGQVLSILCSRAGLLWLTRHDPPASSGPQHKLSTAVDQNSDISQPCVCSRNPSAYSSLVVFLPSLMEAHPSHLSSTQYSKGPCVDFGVFSPGSFFLPDTLTLKFQTPHSSKIPLFLSSCASLEFLLPSLQSGKCLQTHRPDEHKVHTVYFFSHESQSCTAYCLMPETVASFILCSFLTVYCERACPITVTPSQPEAEVNLYEIWPFIKI